MLVGIQFAHRGCTRCRILWLRGASPRPASQQRHSPPSGSRAPRRSLADSGHALAADARGLLRPPFGHRRHMRCRVPRAASSTSHRQEQERRACRRSPGVGQQHHTCSLAQRRRQLETKRKGEVRGEWGFRVWGCIYTSPKVGSSGPPNWACWAGSVAICKKNIHIYSNLIYDIYIYIWYMYMLVYDIFIS